MSEITYQQAVSALSNRVLQEEQLMFLKKSLEKAAKLEVEVSAMESAKVRLEQDLALSDQRVHDAKAKAKSMLDQLAVGVDKQIEENHNRIAIATAKAEAEAAARLARLNGAGDDAQKRLDAINAEVNVASTQLKAANDEMLRTADRAQAEERRLTAARIAVAKMINGDS